MDGAQNGGGRKWKAEAKSLGCRVDQGAAGSQDSWKGAKHPRRSLRLRDSRIEGLPVVDRNAAGSLIVRDTD